MLNTKKKKYDGYKLEILGELTRLTQDDSVESVEVSASMESVESISYG